MFKNFFKTTFRVLLRKKMFTAINVLGLSIGISASLIIFLIVFYEFNYDRFEKNKDRIYRVVMDAKFNGSEGHSSAVQAPLANAVQKEVTGIELTVPVMTFQGDGTAKVRIEKTGATQPLVFKKQADIVFTNPEYFYLLPFKWVAGAPDKSLKNLFNVVLTETRAHEYFPSLPAKDIIGKTIQYNDDFNVTISGIVKDLNEQTALGAVEFISYATIAQTHLQDQFMMNTWNDWMAYSHLYLKLSPGNQPRQIEPQLKALLAKYNKDANRDSANTMHFRLQPLQDIHFNSMYQGFGYRVVNASTLYALLTIAAFLLLLGSINFINLTTANAASRAKEIGIRKTMGTSRKQLVLQFLGETFFITCIAVCISITITPFLFNLFKNFVPPGLTFNFFWQLPVLLFIIAITVVVSFISGIYPALILSGYKPVNVLKNQSFVTKGETRHAWIRKGLTVFQFVIAQFFVIATIMVSRQINYSVNADLGFNKDGIITFDTPRDTVKAHTAQLLNYINMLPGVETASSGFLPPADKGISITNITYAAKKDIPAQVQLRWGTPQYIDVYKIKLLAGRNVAASDTMREFVINNAYARLLGFQEPDDAIGKYLTFDGKQMPVVGVMQDFHDQSTHSEIFPLVFAASPGRTFHIRFKATGAGAAVWGQAISKIEKTFHQIYPGEDFNYKFYDETIANMYEGEKNTASLLSWATGLSVLISCLGLLGLVMYTINTRTKEIGIRKILGATIGNIISILSRDFVLLVVIAFIITIPIAWWATFKWLQDFAYKINMSWWVFAACGAAMLLIALTTLSIQTIKAAIANPVKALRNE